MNTTLVFAYKFKLENLKMKYEVVPGIPSVEHMSSLHLTIWFSKVVPRLRTEVPKAVVGMDSEKVELLEQTFVQTVGKIIDSSFAPARITLMRADVVEKIIKQQGV